MPPVSTLYALADPTRCRIIEILRDGPQPVHVLAAGFTISRPAISRHLRVLKQARLISEKKAGRENLYRLQARTLEPVQRWIADMLPPIAMALPLPTVDTPLLAERVVPGESTPKPRKRDAISQMGFDF